MASPLRRLFPGVFMQLKDGSLKNRFIYFDLVVDGAAELKMETNNEIVL